MVRIAAAPGHRRLVVTRQGCMYSTSQQRPTANPIPASLNSTLPPNIPDIPSSVPASASFARQRHQLLSRLDPHLLTAQTQLNEIVRTLNLTAQSRAKGFSTALRALELEKRVGHVGARINTATGYGEIETLRKGVAERERLLLHVREIAAASKKRYSDAVAKRSRSQREVNDLLSRKSNWSSADVLKFTELVREDHDNEQEEMKARLEMETSDQSVEKGFSDLMQSILERYHEEQVWSDKIRSLSTYGSLAITSLNVFLFIVTILLVEPWKRKRLVEGVESRLSKSTNLSNEATYTSIISLQALLSDAQSKLDQLLTTSSPLPVSSTAPADDQSTLAIHHELNSFLQDSDDIVITADDILEVTKETNRRQSERERELWTVGATGAAAGILVTLCFAVFGR